MPKVLSEKDRKNREEIIILNAIEMFDRSGFSEITMHALAQKCNMAKGTLFNYFATKETLFSRILYREYAQWGAHEQQELEKYTVFTKEEYQTFILEQTGYLLHCGMRMIRLASMKRSIIEKNIAPEVLADEIGGLDETVRTLSALTGQKVDFLTEDEIYRLYMARHVILIGAYELATSPLTIKKLAEINKKDLAVIETEEVVLSMTKEYLNLYCK